MIRIRRPWTWLALVGTFGFILLQFVWTSWPAQMPGCSFRDLTGLHCPGCGGTRCAIRLMKGDIAGAFAMNVAVASLVFVTLVIGSLGLWREWRGGSYRLFPNWLAYGVAVFVIVFGLIRNLPWWPFTLLLPH